MNYIKLTKNTIVNVDAKLNAKLDFAIIESTILAKNLKGTVELKHELGTYLIDSLGNVEVVNGEEPKLKL